MGKTVSKGLQLLEGESYSVHIAFSFLFCAGLAYVQSVAIGEFPNQFTTN